MGSIDCLLLRAVKGGAKSRSGTALNSVVQPSILIKSLRFNMKRPAFCILGLRRGIFGRSVFG